MPVQRDETFTSSREPSGEFHAPGVITERVPAGSANLRRVSPVQVAGREKKKICFHPKGATSANITALLYRETTEYDMSEMKVRRFSTSECESLHFYSCILTV